MTRILGIDPGVTGAVALLDTALDMLVVHDMPTQVTSSGRQEAVPVWLGEVVRDLNPEVAWVERVSAMPRQGVTSSFNFGVSYGIIRGVLGALSVPTHLVTPREWKAALRLPAAKNASRAMACNLFPGFSQLFSRVKDDGRAEAVLIAWFAVQRANKM